MSDEDVFSQIDQLRSKAETAESRRRGDRDVVRIGIVQTIFEIEAKFAREFGRSSPQFDAIRRFSEAVIGCVNKSTINSEE
jgi:hypothetical protein